MEPYKLILKDNNWYLQGYCILREDFRVFKLSRISNIRVLESTLEHREFKAKSLDRSGWIDKELISRIQKLMDIYEEKNKSFISTRDNI
ncbi:MAG: WYL domain-containing protein [Clostridium sp.]|uniref:WYL domain-containing protein n=1 Tax=Clostridium sp. TaxID=1506 RepID=UPI003F35FD6F